MSIYEDFAHQVTPLLAQANQLGYRVTQDVQTSIEQAGDPCQVLHTYIVFDVQTALIQKAQRLTAEMLRRGVDPDELLRVYIEQDDVLHLVNQIQAYAYRVEATRHAQASR